MSGDAGQCAAIRRALAFRDDECDHYEAACDDCTAEAVLSAVRPLIEADLRERLAAAIEAAAACYDEPNATVGEECYAQGLTDAARIVRERP
jgi:hypothetical protein